ncbi:MAG: methionine ABC transporter ATP-binding protein [Mycoplasmataceae bacterium]|jgi:D-methionine transport system ATP-binding protein|nr:methionine ABC transporter ATP-binding protein [Mycoplasmataceae bacterium]
MIKIENVKKTYQVNKKPFVAINNVSLQVPDGKIVGIVGYSGAGKSSLIRTVNGLIIPDSGKVTIDGQVVNELSRKDLRRLCHKVGMVFQHFNLLSSYTVFNNVKLALKIGAKIELRQKINVIRREIKISNFNNQELAGQIYDLKKQLRGLYISYFKHFFSSTIKTQITTTKGQIAKLVQKFNDAETKSKVNKTINPEQIVKLKKEIKHLKKSYFNDLVNDALKLVGLTSKANKYPKALSGGEKQRVGIARAIVNKPKYLLCDEATSALDPSNANEIVAVLKKIKDERDLTILFISHQIEIVKNLCDTIIVMDKGEIVEKQDADSIFSNPIHAATKQIIKGIIFDGKITLVKDQKVYQVISHDDKNANIISRVAIKFNVPVTVHYTHTVSVNNKQITYYYVSFEDEKQEQKIIGFFKHSGLEVKNYVA